MAVVLASLHGQVSGTTRCYELTVQILSQLELNFLDPPIPVLFVGGVDKRLRNLLPLGFLDNSDDKSEDSSSKECAKGSTEDRLLVWPEPVSVQGRNLLLMKMWDFDINEENEDKREIVARCLSVFLSLSTHCVVNFESNEVFRGLNYMQDMYERLLRREGGGLHRTHFVVPRKVEKQEIDEYKSRPEGQKTNFVSVKDLQEPEGFSRHLLDDPDGPIPISMKTWTYNLLSAANFVSIDSDIEFFVQHFPRFSMFQTEPFAQLLEECKQNQYTLRQASVCKFIARGRPPSCKFDESFITTLQRLPTSQEDLSRDMRTVVLTVIGEPNIGKSTFLDYLIQRAFRSRKLYPFFAKGMTEDSSILSCLLPLPDSSNKMLLIDLEGLSDTTSLSESDALMSSNLVSGVLAVTSVPCFFIENLDIHQQKQIERCIELYVCLSRNLNFSCDRLFILFQDQDFMRGEQPDNEWITKMNKRFFSGRPVIRLMNKPSFNNPGKAEMCRDFLDTFLADCDFPKSSSVAEIVEKIRSNSKNFSTEQFPVDFTYIVELKNEEVRKYRSKSELLLFIQQDPGSLAYFVKTADEVMEKLLTNFRDCPNITPVLCIGNSQCGRSAILDSLLRRELEQLYCAEEVLGNFSNFASEGYLPGVYVWPNPVQVGDATLLLMKMWGMDFREPDEALGALNDQMISALLCITSVCLVCTEKSALFDALKRVQRLYSEVRQTLKLTVSQFVVFAENERQFASSESQKSIRKFRESIEGQITTFLYRGDRGISESCCDELCNLLANPSLHRSYLESHQNIQENIQAKTIAGIIELMLKILTSVVNLDLGYRRFVETIPHFGKAEFKQQMNELKVTETYLKEMREGEALNFFVKDGNSCRFDISVLRKLQINYNLEKPTIVLATIGKPGIGKSTFLNRLIQMNTGSRLYREFFKTGNTGEHTTRGSQVLSQPLRIGDNQLMLIDLEGIGGSETVDTGNTEMQKTLVSAILRVVSVPCIVVKNKAASIKYVEDAIEKLIEHKRVFGFPIERVHLLFHDRDVIPSGCDNQDFLRLADKLDRKYFEGSQVVKMRNKPSFNASGKDEMCEEFLKDLLADSSFPKRNKSGAFTNISKLLVEMEYIMGCNIELTDEESSEASRIETEKGEQLKKIAKEIICTEEGMSLIQEFDKRYEDLKRTCISEIEGIKSEKRKKPFSGEIENVRKHVMTVLENEARVQRIELSQIDYCYHAVRSLNVIELKKAMKELLLYFYRDTHWIKTFLGRADEFKLKLEKVKERYPRESEKMVEVLRKFEKKQVNLRNWFIMKSTFGFNEALVTGGLGFTAKGAQIAVVVAERAAAGAAVSGIAAFGRLSYSVANSLIVNETAVDLYDMDWFSTSLNKRISNVLQASGDAQLYVMVVIGNKFTKASNLLNEFVLRAMPFTPHSTQIFKESKLTQVTHFCYQRPGSAVRSENIHAFLIYLRMKKNLNKRNNRIVRRLTTELFMRVPLTCLLYNRPDNFAEQMLDETYAMRKGWNTSPFQPKLAVLHSHESRRDFRFFTKLESLSVPRVEVGIGNFDEQGIQSGLLTVKREFENSAPISSSTLLEILRNAEAIANC